MSNRRELDTRLVIFTKAMEDFLAEISKVIAKQQLLEIEIEQLKNELAKKQSSSET